MKCAIFGTTVSAKFASKSIGFGESLSNQAEIDADAYTIKYLAKKHKISLEEAAAIICPEEKAHYKDAYYTRLNTWHMTCKKKTS